MKRWFMTLWICLSIIPIAAAQETAPTMDEMTGLISGGIGMTIIEENGEQTQYININLQPEIALGKLGAGLNINILYNPDAEEGEDSIRESDLELERILRYVRWGQKRDPVYARIGALDHATLGHGFIMSNYQNQIFENDLKLGLSLDMDGGLVGFESSTSNLKRLEIIGGRAYLRPISYLDIPVLNRLAFGATYVADMDPDKDADTDDEVVIWGIDAELPVLESPALNILLYADYAQIQDFGDGTAAGAMFQVPGLGGLIDATLKVERRFLQEQFRAQYFDAFYETNRQARMATLPTLKAVNGTFGELTASVLQQIHIQGSYQYFDDTDYGGTAHSEVELVPNAVPRLMLRGTYDKTGVETLEDLVTLDSRSLANGYIGFGLTSYLFLTMQYEWNLSRDENDQLITHERITPRLDLRVNF